LKSGDFGTFSSQKSVALDFYFILFYFGSPSGENLLRKQSLIRGA
jgi:hypothetical protein